MAILEAKAISNALTWLNLILITTPFKPSSLKLIARIDKLLLARKTPYIPQSSLILLFL
jgi:hypothetical protein